MEADPTTSLAAHTMGGRTDFDANGTSEFFEASYIPRSTSTLPKPARFQTLFNLKKRQSSDSRARMTPANCTHSNAVKFYIGSVAEIDVRLVAAC